MEEIKHEHEEPNEFMRTTEELMLASRQVGSKAGHAFCEIMQRMTHETALSDGKGNTDKNPVKKRRCGK